MPEHVVFVSYATVDNHPHPSAWVSAFVKSLDENLHAAFGFKDENRIWWDRKNIDEEASLTEQIRRKARESQCMVIVFSRGYLSSRWCREERDAFLAAAKDNPELQSSLFLIDIGNVKVAERPVEFQDKKGRDFWVQADGSDKPGDRVPAGHPLPDPENRDHTVFYTRINSLARAIRDRVCSEKSIPPINSGTTVFVAEAADDVAEQREEVVDFFQIIFPLSRASMIRCH